MTRHQITYGELLNGDIVYIAGYRFRVQNCRISSRKGEGDNTDDVIRFEGTFFDNVSLKGTGYDGGTYGAYAFAPCLVERNI